MIKKYLISTSLYFVIVLVLSWYIGTLNVSAIKAGVTSGLIALILGSVFGAYWIKNNN